MYSHVFFLFQPCIASIVTNPLSLHKKKSERQTSFNIQSKPELLKFPYITDTFINLRTSVFFLKYFNNYFEKFCVVRYLQNLKFCFLPTGVAKFSLNKHDHHAAYLKLLSYNNFRLFCSVSNVHN